MRLVAVLVLVAVFFVASSEAGLFKDNEYVKMFQQFITKFKRAYSTSTFAKKLVAFKRNIDTITSANKVKGRFQLGVNQFADLSASEFKAYLGARPPTSGAALIEAQAEGESAAEMTEEELNASFAGGFSWEDKLLAPRMQHQCGSCYSFAAASTIEAAVAIAGGKKEYIAPQPAVNCAAGCFGCNGGFATCVFKYATDTGYFKETDAPYLNKVASCTDKTLTPLGKISSYKRVSGSAASFATALKVNPLWITLDANANVQFYKSGIIDSTANCSKTINHAVVIVGQGSSNGANYWTVRNSWSDTWGEKGNFRINADEDTCGIYVWGAFYPIVKK